MELITDSAKTVQQKLRAIEMWLQWHLTSSLQLGLFSYSSMINLWISFDLFSDLAGGQNRQKRPNY